MRISIKEKQDNVYLTVSDNGIGIDNSIDVQNPDTLGLTLVNTLVDQLHGKLEVDCKNGTKVSITYKKKSTKGSGANTFFLKRTNICRRLNVNNIVLLLPSKTSLRKRKQIPFRK